ncbi:hypothetical protein CBR_g29614 [Chara braunii]|uniref:Uncharacterized protein n=1 Tax=Chara braunii TaxID=69332 RepID=A0A388LAY3_CHABU|nr:hypothetical protein CBR_g29614 [Chara braunii]|eukprot:GBG79468.1 hypothetical protein CBR_g29614 [Chara braunii]
MASRGGHGEEEVDVAEEDDENSEDDDEEEQRWGRRRDGRRERGRAGGGRVGGGGDMNGEEREDMRKRVVGTNSLRGSIVIGGIRVGSSQGTVGKDLRRVLSGGQEDPPHRHGPSKDMATGTEKGVPITETICVVDHMEEEMSSDDRKGTNAQTGGQASFAQPSGDGYHGPMAKNKTASSANPVKVREIFRTFRQITLATEINDFLDYGEDTEQDAASETSDEGVVALIKEKTRGTEKQKVGRSKGQGDQGTPAWVKLGSDYEMETILQMTSGNRPESNGQAKQVNRVVQHLSRHYIKPS